MIENQDSGKRLANAIENKLNMNRKDIQELTTSEFRSLLRHGFFVQKGYHGRQTEPTNGQMDVLNLHYGKKEFLRNVNQKYYNRHKLPSGNLSHHFPNKIRKNVGGRYIDAETGRFVSIKR